MGNQVTIFTPVEELAEIVGAFGEAYSKYKLRVISNGMTGHTLLSTLQDTNCIEKMFEEYEVSDSLHQMFLRGVLERLKSSTAASLPPSYNSSMKSHSQMCDVALCIVF